MCHLCQAWLDRLLQFEADTFELQQHNDDEDADDVDDEAKDATVKNNVRTTGAVTAHGSRTSSSSSSSKSSSKSKSSSSSNSRGRGGVGSSSNWRASPASQRVGQRRVAGVGGTPLKRSERTTTTTKTKTKPTTTISGDSDSSSGGAGDGLRAWALLRALECSVCRRVDHQERQTRSHTHTHAHSLSLTHTLTHFPSLTLCLSCFGASPCRLPCRGPHTLCVLCGHGGHEEHLAAWFAKSSTCPVPGCSCTCK